MCIRDSIITAFLKSGKDFLKIQPALAGIAAVVVSQVYMDVVGTVLPDGFIQVLFLQVQMENIHHQPEVGPVYPLRCV